MLKPVVEEAIGALLTYRNLPGRGSVDGVTELLRQRPSGRTLGVLNGADMVGAALAGELPLQPEEFTIFGRIVDSQQGLFTGKRGPGKGPRTVRDILQTDSTRTWGITGPGNFFSGVLIARILGIRPRFVADFQGPREAAEAAAAGKIDIVQLETATAMPSVLRQKLRPLATVGSKMTEQSKNRRDQIPRLADVADNIGAHSEDVVALRKLLDTGIVIAGPPHIPGVRARCIGDGIHKAMSSMAFKSVAIGARMPIAPLDSEAARKSIEQAASSAEKYKELWLKGLEELSP